MKEQLQGFISQLLTLKQPIEFITIHKLFEENRQLFESRESIPEDMLEQWQLLGEIAAHLEDWQKSRVNLHLFHTYQKKLAEDKGQAAKEIRLKRGVEKTLSELESQLKRKYTAIYQHYAAEQQTEDPLRAIYIASDTWDDKLVQDHHYKLVEEQKQLLQKNALIMLYENNLALLDIKNQIKELGLFVVSYMPRNLQETRVNFEGEKKRYDDLLQQLSRSHQQLAQSISTKEIGDKISNTTRKIEETRCHLLEIEMGMKSMDIESIDRNTLLQQYIDATDKEEYIRNQGYMTTLYDVKTAITGWVTSIPQKVGSLVRWETPADPEDLSSKESALKINKHFQFTLALHRQHQLQQQFEILTTQLKHAETLKSEAVPCAKTEEIHYHASRLLNEAAQLIYPDKEYLFSEDMDNIELLRNFINFQQKLSDNKDQLEKGINLLINYQKTAGCNAELRTRYEITSILEEDLFNDIKILRDDKNARQVRREKLDYLEQSIRSCEKYLAIAKRRNDAHIRVEDCNKLLLTLKKSIRALQSELKRLGSLDELEQKNLEAQKAVCPFIERLARVEAEKLSDLHVSTKPDSLPAIFESESFSSERHPYQETLGKQDEKIRQLQKNMPPDWYRWYRRLYEVLINQDGDEKLKLQSIQLLRDIHFELQHPDASAPYAVLQRYRQLCPDPERDCDTLLALKPALPINPDDLSPLKNEKLQEQLQRLQRQQGKMADNHPREAALLKQATDNLHQIALQIEDGSPEDLPENFINNLNDPRYESLQRHRGFLKIVEWLAEFCTSILGLIRRQPEENYRHRFFFVPTHTTQLLETTHQELIACTA
ncbi:hypothetical protein [Legionella spiritensis]|uniref:Effector protein A, substrate of the Dot/Icm secretion system n=1 Tax=Legionella spiritensis TaxID=452 RepID=A0A0W0Z725_LEGSP|nr:hypothetical protein [Legionella spiritensis]KTD64734.1 effector protein A, substrate of the Dot/Icm secretion system [Legionella spiritensis]SNV48104.1 interaptin [Legionella spiritensis]